MKILSVLLTLLIATTIHGDGIPVTADLKSVTVETFTISLNKDQVAQVGQLRKLTLTDAQRRPLLAIDDQIPREITVVSSRWDSCTCEFDVYGIWCRPGEVEIPRGRIASNKVLDDYRSQNPVEEEEPETEPDLDRYDFRKFILDSAGKIYSDGKEIQESEILSTIEVLFERRKKRERLVCSIVLDLPPPIDNTTDAGIHALAKRIETRCTERNIGFWALGLSDEWDG